jgi:hypothetical protein
VINSRTCCPALMAITLIVACGGREPERRRDPATDKVLASASDVAKEAKKGIRCPAPAPARPAGDPVDDILGVRPGMTWDEAVRGVSCSHDLMVINPTNERGFQLATRADDIRQGFTAAFAEAEKTTAEIIEESQRVFSRRLSNSLPEEIAPGQSEWLVTAIGMPGKERVIAIARTESFPEDAQPTVATVLDALRNKYGPGSTPARGGYRGSTGLVWQHRANGRAAQVCDHGAGPAATVNLSPDCGLVISASVEPRRDNDAIAVRLHVSVVDQARGYQALDDLELALKQRERDRKAGEVQQAQQRGGQPKL